MSFNRHSGDGRIFVAGPIDEIRSIGIECGLFEASYYLVEPRLGPCESSLKSVDEGRRDDAAPRHTKTFSAAGRFFGQTQAPAKRFREGRSPSLKGCTNLAMHLGHDWRDAIEVAAEYVEDAGITASKARWMVNDLQAEWHMGLVKTSRGRLNEAAGTSADEIPIQSNNGFPRGNVQADIPKGHIEPGGQPEKLLGNEDVDIGANDHIAVALC